MLPLQSNSRKLSGCVQDEAKFLTIAEHECPLQVLIEPLLLSGTSAAGDTL